MQDPPGRPPTQPTPTQAQIAEMAAAMAANNVDAAEALGRALVHEAERLKRVRGFMVAIRWNAVTEQIEIVCGE